MAWTASAMFQAWPHMMIGNFGANNFVSLEEDTLKASLFGTSVTPDKDALITSTGLGTGVWTGEITDGTNWDTGGEPLTGKTASDQGSGITQFTATNTPQSGASTTLSAVFGCLVYDDTTTAGTGGVADQGVTYHYFGGSQSVTAGTFTIVWHANGLFRITNS